MQECLLTGLFTTLVHTSFVYTVSTNCHPELVSVGSKCTFFLFNLKKIVVQHSAHHEVKFSIFFSTRSIYAISVNLYFLVHIRVHLLSAILVYIFAGI